MSAGAVAGLIAAGAFVSSSSSRATRCSSSARSSTRRRPGAPDRRAIDEITDRSGRRGTTVDEVNTALAGQRRAGPGRAITTNVETITGNISALTSVFAATLGSPMIKVAAFSYGVRRAASKRPRPTSRRGSRPS